MIFKGSRYDQVKTYQVTGPTGQTVTVFGIRFVRPTPAGFQHACTAADRLDLLAFKFYRNPEKFWLIADANTEMDPDDLLEPGRRLWIPPDRT